MYRIEQLSLEELDTAINLIWKTFQRFEAIEYSEEGIQTFKNVIDHDALMSAIENGFEMYVAKINQHMAGVIAIRDQSHISLLFVDESYHRKGIGTALFHHIEAKIKNKGLKFITVNSSPYGIAFYHTVGFVDENDEQVVDGIRFTPMKYTL